MILDKTVFLLHKWKHVGKFACHHAYQTYETVALMRFVMEVVEPYTGLADVMTFEVKNLNIYFRIHAAMFFRTRYVHTDGGIHSRSICISWSDLRAI